MKIRKRNRLEHYDYSKDGYYYVTICTRSHRNWLGEVVEGEMRLSKKGRIVSDCWEDSPKHFENIHLDKFVVMPNHVHGILIMENGENVVGNQDDCSVGNADLRSLQNRTKMLLPKVIHGFKSSATRIVRKQFNNHSFGWHKSFYDHVIRDDTSLLKVQEYIQNNPAKWELDKYNPKNLIQ